MNVLENRLSTHVAAVAVALGALVIGTAAVASDGEDPNTPIMLDIEPLFEDEGESLRAVGEFRGVSRKHGARVMLVATAEVVIECWRSGETSFHKRFELTLEHVDRIPKHEIKGNRIDVDIETEQAKVALFAWYGPQETCPNGWNHYIEEVSFLDARVEIQQRHTDVAKWLCTFDVPSNDGTIQPEDVDCQMLN